MFASKLACRTKNAKARAEIEVRAQRVSLEWTLVCLAWISTENH